MHVQQVAIERDTDPLLLDAVASMIEAVTKRSPYLEYDDEDHCYFGELPDGEWIIIRESVFEQARDAYAAAYCVNWQQATQAALNVKRWRVCEGRPIFSL